MFSRVFPQRENEGEGAYEWIRSVFYEKNCPKAAEIRRGNSRELQKTCKMPMLSSRKGNFQQNEPPFALIGKRISE